MWTVSATAARYVPMAEPAVARNSSPNSGERRTRPRRLLLSTGDVDASTWPGFSLRPFWARPAGPWRKKAVARATLRAAHRGRHAGGDDPCESYLRSAVRMHERGTHHESAERTSVHEDHEVDRHRERLPLHLGGKEEAVGGGTLREGRDHEPPERR